LEKSANPREGLAQNPLAQSYQSMSMQSGLRTSNGITMQTLRRMSRYNWVDRTCIFTLRDKITALPWDIAPIDPDKPYDKTFQQIRVALLYRPNRNNENFRTFWDKIVEHILVIDRGIIEKVRNDRGKVVELFYTDRVLIKSPFDVQGIVGEPAYQQFMAEQWNPQAAMDT
jgi:hypothetical protein